jgi:hypothetical protein
MEPTLPSLDSLGRKYETDKASGVHDYLSLYEPLLQGVRHERVRVLEVGILGGASLRMWAEYFPNGTIIGADIHPGVKSFKGDRIVTEIVDQSNLEDLGRLCARHGPFDVVIDDGSHMWEHQITSFKTIFPFVRPGGLYIIEDLHTNFGDFTPHYRGVSSISCVDYLQKLVALKVADDTVDISAEEDPFLRTYGRAVEFITFLRRACIVKKGGRPSSPYIPGTRAPEAAAQPLIPVAGQSFPLSLACHIGMIGDWHSDTGAITSPDNNGDNSGRDIQGFIIYDRSLAATALEYRARLADGGWTDWVTCGTFAGTMGLARPLTGFSARLPNAGNSDMTVRLAGLFRGQTDPVLVGNEEDCISDSGAGELYGMQCLVERR